jgi:hypothetical protein
MKANEKLAQMHFKHWTSMTDPDDVCESHAILTQDVAVKFHEWAIVQPKEVTHYRNGFGALLPRNTDDLFTDFITKHYKQ